MLLINVNDMYYVETKTLIIHNAHTCIINKLIKLNSNSMVLHLWVAVFIIHLFVSKLNSY